MIYRWYIDDISMIYRWYIHDIYSKIGPGAITGHQIGRIKMISIPTKTTSKNLLFAAVKSWIWAVYDRFISKILKKIEKNQKIVFFFLIFYFRLGSLWMNFGEKIILRALSDKIWNLFTKKIAKKICFFLKILKNKIAKADIKSKWIFMIF